VLIIGRFAQEWSSLGRFAEEWSSLGRFAQEWSNKIGGALRARMVKYIVVALRARMFKSLMALRAKMVGKITH